MSETDLRTGAALKIAGELVRLAKELTAAPRKVDTGHAENLKKLYSELNSVIFGGSLPKDISVKYGPTGGASVLGIAIARARYSNSLDAKLKRNPEVIIEGINISPKLQGANEKFILGILTHEMCHIQEYAQGVVNENHGLTFMKSRSQAQSKANSFRVPFLIPVKETLHDKDMEELSKEHISDESVIPSIVVKFGDSYYAKPLAASILSRLKVSSSEETKLLHKFATDYPKYDIRVLNIPEKKIGTIPSMRKIPDRSYEFSNFFSRGSIKLGDEGSLIDFKVVIPKYEEVKK